MVQAKLRECEERILSVIDGQGKDIAYDFSEFERKLGELREQVDSGLQEASSALIKISEDASSHSKQQSRAPSISLDHIERAISVSNIEFRMFRV